MSDTITKQLICLHCEKPIKGRIDKKFCDDWCRNAYNNRRNSQTTILVKGINSILKKNRSILETVISPEKGFTKLSRQKLSEKGFNFQYFTHTYTTKKGVTYFFCYEYGYLFIENDHCLIVSRSRNDAI